MLTLVNNLGKNPPIKVRSINFGRQANQCQSAGKISFLLSDSPRRYMLRGAINIAKKVIPSEELPKFTRHVLIAAAGGGVGASANYALNRSNEDPEAIKELTTVLKQVKAGGVQIDIKPLPTPPQAQPPVFSPDKDDTIIRSVVDGFGYMDNSHLVIAVVTTCVAIVLIFFIKNIVNILNSKKIKNPAIADCVYNKNLNELRESTVILIISALFSFALGWFLENF